MNDGAKILELPPWLLIIRIAQAVLALTIFALACYGVSVSSFDGDSLILFTALATLIILSYILVSEHFFPQAYNFWAILALDSFAVLFWLVSFALLASEVNGTGYWFLNGCYYYACFKRSLVKRYGTFRSTMAAAAGLGGVEFALFIVSLVVVGIYVHRERTAGAEPSTAPTAPTTQTATQPPANPQNLEQGEIEMQSQTPSGVQQAQIPRKPVDPSTAHVD